MRKLKPTSPSPSRDTQRGGFLLEALIAILIFSFGILGIVGLQAQSIRHVNDAQYRSEAIYLANSLVSSMWAEDVTTIKNNYDSTIGTGAGYLAFKARVAQLPGGTVQDPDVVFAPALTLTSEVVTVTVYWLEPGEIVGTTPHQYTTTAVIGNNRT